MRVEMPDKSIEEWKNLEDIILKCPHINKIEETGATDRVGK